ncbi:MAG TPA: carboxypeptidase-like regulatory domain-containing protein [Cyclobacteriaceae bacterium]|nr:carboxypeptidase-like regulatory domain-containing protein [Cyclobacteriaceae bacterium]
MGRILFIVFTLISLQARSCFILFLSDGKSVLVGNHEDWFAKDAAIKVNPPQAGKFGSVIFTFMSEGWAQGGMNEKGLFFDAAHTPLQEIEFDKNAEKPPSYIWQTILDKFETVEEAVQFLRTYQLPELREMHVMLADAKGHAVIIGVQNGRLAVQPFVQTYLMQTNFNPWHPELSEEPVCWRYEKTKKSLSVNAGASVENMRSILEQTHQDSLTVYSNIYDLKNKVIYTYNKRDFSKAMVVRLPELFGVGRCTRLLDSLYADSTYWKKCNDRGSSKLHLTAKVVDANTKQPVAFANIGIFEKNIGTLSDPDGSFELDVPPILADDSIILSSIGYDRRKIPIQSVVRFRAIELTPSGQLLKEAVITAKKIHNKVARLGWMGGKDGVLPFDTIQGGGAVALLIESPSTPCQIERLQVRLMYNSKKELMLRLHFFSFDSTRQMPGEELLKREIILTETQRFGWLRFDLSKDDIVVYEKRFFVAFEWIDDRQTRNSLLTGFRAWENWKRNEYQAGNQKVEKIIVKTSQGDKETYKYHGNMMSWPGFKYLPPFTGLMVQTGKDETTKALRTFERKTSMGKWEELNSTLNAVITIRH